MGPQTKNDVFHLKTSIIEDLVDLGLHTCLELQGSVSLLNRTVSILGCHQERSTDRFVNSCRCSGPTDRLLE